MKSFAFAAQIAVLASTVAAQAAQPACGQPGMVTCGNGQPPLMSMGSRISICQGTTPPTIPAANQLPQSQTSGITDAQACAALCAGTNACVRANFNGGTGACILGNNPVTAAELTGLTAGANLAFEFILPPCAVSSSSIIASSSAVASSSAAVVASSSAAVSVASSAAVGVSSSAAVVASSSVAVVASSVSSSAAAASASALSTGPSCPQSNGQAFTAVAQGGNSIFNIVCGSGTVGKRSLPAPIARRQVAAPLNAFGICITACANVPTCQSLLFNPVNGACALFDCVVPVPAGLSGATRVTLPGGAPFAGRVCPPNTPTTIPAQPITGTNGTAPAINLNLNINVNVNVNVIAGKYKGVPYTQICCLAKCKPCAVCEETPVEQCSVCEQKGKPSPLKPSSSYCPPGIPGKPGFPGTCTDCEYTKPSPSAATPCATCYPSASAPYSSPTSAPGKYTGPYSNDAVSRSGMSALFGGAAALAFALA